MWIWLYVRKRWCSSWERQGANVEQVKTSETKWCNFSWFLVLRWTFAGIRRRRVLIRRMCVKGAAVSGSSDIHVYKINKRWRWWRPVMTFQAFLFCSLSFIHCWASLERPLWDRKSSGLRPLIQISPVMPVANMLFKTNTRLLFTVCVFTRLWMGRIGPVHKSQPQTGFSGSFFLR